MKKYSEPLVALEIGTHRVRCLVADELPDGRLQITALAEVPSRGVRKSEIVDGHKACECVRQVLAEAEAQSGVIIHQVLLLTSAGRVQTTVNSGRAPVLSEDGTIGEDEIEAARTCAKAVNLPHERQLMHAIPQGYTVDDTGGIIEPRGMTGNQLGVEMLLLHGLRMNIRNVTLVAENAHVEAEATGFGGLCAGLSALTADQKERGAVVIDLGAGTTDFVAYANKSISYASSIAVGGEHVTNDIAYGFNIAKVVAERIKLEHSSATIDLSRHHSTMRIEDANGVGNNECKLADLDTIVHLRMEETLKLIRDELMRNNLNSKISGGVVFTGGGARMRNLCELGGTVFQLPCRIGHSIQVGGLKEITSAPEYTALVGMLRYGASSRRSQDNRNILGGLFNFFKPRNS